MKQPQTVSWNIAEECRFLDNIGTFSEPPKDRKECLIGYLTAKRPYHWTLEDETTISLHAARLLKKVKP
jgi:hypothetical protein